MDTTNPYESVGSGNRLAAQAEPVRGGARISRLAKGFRATWKTSLLISIAIVALGALGAVAVRVIAPATTTYKSELYFKWPEANTGRYPNGTEFSMNEIIDPDVLAAVYAELQLGRYGIDAQQFYSGFSVRPFAPTVQEVVERYRDQLSDRRLTFPERQNIETQLRQHLEQLSRLATEITFTIRGRENVPTEVGRNIVHAVARMWARVAVEKKGVLNIPGFYFSDTILSPEEIKNSSLPVAITLIAAANATLKSRFVDLRDVPGLMAARDDKTGKTIRDLEQDESSIELLRVNKLRAALSTYGFKEAQDDLGPLIERRIQDLEMRQARVERDADEVNNSIKQYVNSIVGLKGKAAQPTASGTFAGTTTIPQLTEGFIDKIIELLGHDQDQKSVTLVSDLTKRQLVLRESAVGLRDEAQQWKELSVALTASQSLKPPDPEIRANLLRNVNSVLNELNAIWGALTRVQSNFTSNRLGHAAKLYEPFATPDDVIVATPVTAWRLALGIMAMLMIIMIVWLSRAWRQAPRLAR